LPEQAKHIDVHCHFMQQLVEDGEVELKYCPTHDRIIDIFTKSLDPNKLEKFKDKLDMVSKMTIRMTIKRRC
jgi:hypothetical protein